MAKRPPSKPPKSTKARRRGPEPVHPHRGKRKGEAGELPPVLVADVVERDADGDLFVRPTQRDNAPMMRLWG
jgi:hypothetical protein